MQGQVCLLVMSTALSSLYRKGKAQIAKTYFLLSEFWTKRSRKTPQYNLSIISRLVTPVYFSNVVNSVCVCVKVCLPERAQVVGAGWVFYKVPHEFVVCIESTELVLVVKIPRLQDCSHLNSS